MDNKAVRNDNFVAALLDFFELRTTENQNKLIKEMGKSRFLVPVKIKGEIKDGVLEKNSEIEIKLMADKYNNLFYAVFTDWEALTRFSGKNEDAIAVTYKEIREILKIEKADITGIVINPSIYDRDFVMTEKIMMDMDKRLEELTGGYKAVIFDLDGTLADSLESIACSANRVMEELGFKCFETERFKYFAGDGADTLLKRCLAAAGDEKLEYYEKAAEKYRDFFEKGCTYRVEPYEGIRELINALRARKIKIAVLTNKPQDRAVDVINNLFGQDCFDIVLGHCTERKKKPSPEGAFYIAEKLGLERDKCVYVGDTNTDMKTGRSAGMFTIGVLWGFRDRKELEENGADMIVEKPEEILKLF